MQKYDEKALYNTARKVLGDYIKEIQKEINEYLNSRSTEIHWYIYTKQKSIDSYDGYSIYQNKKKIGIYVCTFNYREMTYNDYDYKEDKNKVLSIIKHKKLPINFTVEEPYDGIVPVEICVNIQDLIKIDPSIKADKSISKSDAHTIINSIFKKKNNSIKSSLKKIIDKYNAQNILNISDYFYADSYNYNPSPSFKNNIDINIILYKSDIGSKGSEQVIDQLIPNIEIVMKKYIPFKFKVYKFYIKDYNFGGIGISIDYDDMKNNNESIKYLREFTTANNIFESVQFI